MAKMYYNQEETLAKLDITEDQLRGMVRSGELREFRDAGKLNYRTEEVDRLVRERAAGSKPGDSGGLSLMDTGEIALAPDDSDPGTAPKPSGGGKRGGSDAPIELTGSGSGDMALVGSDAGLKLDESGTGIVQPPPPPAPAAPAPAPLDLGLGGSESGLRLEESGAGDLRLSDSKGGTGSDAMSLDEVDKDRVDSMKKDDTVITNIGISVFDDEELEIAADPMAKTMITQGSDSAVLDGSGAGTGLLDLTRESDDTSLGAELLEGIDMGDTAENAPPVVTAEAPEPVSAGAELTEPTPEPVMPAPTPRGVLAVPMVEAASPLYTGLLAAAALALTLLGALVVATSMGVWPGYLDAVAANFWYSLGGAILLGGLGAGIGALTNMKSTGPKAPKKPKEPKAAKPVKEKAKKGK